MIWGTNTFFTSYYLIWKFQIVVYHTLLVADNRQGLANKYHLQHLNCTHLEQCNRKRCGIADHNFVILKLKRWIFSERYDVTGFLDPPQSSPTTYRHHITTLKNTFLVQLFEQAYIFFKYPKILSFRQTGNQGNFHDYFVN